MTLRKIYHFLLKMDVFQYHLSFRGSNFLALMKFARNAGEVWQGEMVFRSGRWLSCFWMKMMMKWCGEHPKYSTLLGTSISLPIRHFWVDDVPFPVWWDMVVSGRVFKLQQNVSRALLFCLCLCVCVCFFHLFSVIRETKQIQLVKNLPVKIKLFGPF